ncbi:PspC domain-containing protein [Streptomyces sp. TR02-1]|uniref:PspC domain-containing protein n=1 Tax=Streptomyces sp. TR02-1 TaxID=3385977 RepID=UPI0039A0058D
MDKEQPPPGGVGASAAPEAAEPPDGGPWHLPLHRSRRHRLVGGVCGGLGRHFGLDPVVFRVPVAVLSLIGGLGLVFYGFAWLAVPEEGERENELRRLLSGRVEGTSLAAILVALVGCGVFLTSLRAGYTSFSLLVAGAVAGAAYWSRYKRGADPVEPGEAPGDAAHTAVEVPPETQAPPEPSAPAWWRDPLSKEGPAPPAHTADGRYLWGPDESGASTPGGRADIAASARTPRRSHGGPVFAVAQLAALAAGVLALREGRGVADSLVVALSSALLVYGVAFAVTAFAGRVGTGTVFAVVLTAFGLAAASVIPGDITADWSDHRWQPASAAAVHPRYAHGTGRGTLDLTRARPGPGETVRTTVRVGAGELRVLVPDDVAVRADYAVDLGGYRVPSVRDPFVAGRVDGSESPPDSRPGGSDFGGGLRVSGSRLMRPADDAEDSGRLVLDLEVGIGELVVKRKEAVAP